MVSSFCLCCIKIHALEQACLEARRMFFLMLAEFQRATADYIRNTLELAENLWKLSVRFITLQRYVAEF